MSSSISSSTTAKTRANMKLGEVWPGVNRKGCVGRTTVLTSFLKSVMGGLNKRWMGPVGMELFKTYCCVEKLLQKCLDWKCLKTNSSWEPFSTPPTASSISLLPLLSIRPHQTWGRGGKEKEAAVRECYDLVHCRVPGSPKPRLTILKAR